MTNYRKIIRLNSLGCSRNTVSEVLKLAETHSLGCPISEALTNIDIEQLFYPNIENNEVRKLPNYEYIYNKLTLKVTLSLLWAKYLAKCESNIPFLTNTQSNEKYHAYATSKKATLRIKHKPSKAMAVDWVGGILTVCNVASG